MFIFTKTAAILSLACFGFAAFIFTKKKKTLLSKYFISTIVFIGFWVGGNALADTAKNDLTTIIFSAIAVLGSLYMSSAFLIFVDLFINEKENLSSLKKIIFIAPSVIFTPIAFTKLHIAETFYPAGSPAQMVPGKLYILAALFVLGSLIYNIIRLGYHYRKSTPIKKMQIIYIELGFLIVISAGLLFNAVLPLLGYLQFYNIGPQFSVFLIGFTAYAILKHQLLDIKIIIQRGLFYTLILSFIIGFYLFLLCLITLFLEDKTGHIQYLIASLLTTITGIFTVGPIEKYFQKATDKLFFKNKYDYSNALQILSTVVNKNIYLLELLLNISKTLKDLLKTKEINILLPNENAIFKEDEGLKSSENNLIIDFIKNFEGKILPILTYNRILEKSKAKGGFWQELENFIKKENIKIIVPIFLEKKLVGIMTLNEKISGDEYTREDLKLLKTFSLQAAVAIEKARLYKKVKEYSTKLEEKVKDRTKRLENLQEYQKRMMLDISHGLQTPITIVRGQLDLMQKQLPQCKGLENTKKSIDRISKFIYDLLTLAKLETTEEFKKEKIDLSEVLEELIEYFNILVAEKNIIIKKEIEPNIFILGDKNKLEHLITNLMSNAIKYIGRGNMILIELKKEDEKTVIIMKDNGIGIEEKDLPLIFDRFYRTSSPNKQKGSGIGLAVCKKIVELHNGKIEVESEVGKGSSFIIKL